MGRFLYIFLMLIMLTPSMACVMAMCAPVSAQAAAVSEGDHPCPGHAKAQDLDAKAPLLNIDCQKTEMGQTTSPDVPAPILIFAVIALAAFSLTILTPAHAPRLRFARPPPGRRVFQPDILLTTARFRE